MLFNITISQPFLLLNYLEKVDFGSLEHSLPIGVWIISLILIITLSRKKLTIGSQWRLIHYIAVLISFTVVGYHIYKITFYNYRIDKDLPLYLCSLLAILIPIFTYYKKYWMFEILVFWIIAGTLQAVITPDIKQTFPSMEYFRYWIVHLGLLTVIMYIIFVFKWRPKLKSVYKSFLALQVYVIMIVAINYVLDSNYFYLNEKPESTTLLDYMGDWPWYIVVGQIILIPYFLLIYLPFHIVELRSK